MLNQRSRPAPRGGEKPSLNALLAKCVQVAIATAALQPERKRRRRHCRLRDNRRDRVVAHMEEWLSRGRG